ncbi:MAG: hypothetical protein ACPG4N_05985 [Gammaproteobacteria bacterium]
MLTVEDCVHFSDSNDAEIEAISEHEHVDSVVACELAAEFSATPQGRRAMIQIMVDDIVHAEQHKNFQHASELRHTLNNYVNSHHYL